MIDQTGLGVCLVTGLRVGWLVGVGGAGCGGGAGARGVVCLSLNAGSEPLEYGKWGTLSWTFPRMVGARKRAYHHL